MKKITALLLALIMVLALAACGGGSSAPAEVEVAPAAEAPVAPAAPEAEAAPEAAAPAAGDDFEEWKAYLTDYAMAGAPSEEAGQAVADQIAAAATVEDVEAIAELTVIFGDVGALGFDEWVAAGKPAADIENMGSPTGEPSGEPTGDPPAQD